MHTGWILVLVLLKGLLVLVLGWSRAGPPKKLSDHGAIVPGNRDVSWLSRATRVASVFPSEADARRTRRVEVAIFSNLLGYVAFFWRLCVLSCAVRHHQSGRHRS